MFSRIRASIAGEATSSPDKSPRPTTPTNNLHERHHNPPQQRPGFLPPFFSNQQAANGSESSRHQAPPPQAQERSFFSGLFDQSGGGGNSPNPTAAGRNYRGGGGGTPNSVEQSPGTIRASAAALLKLATAAPPPFPTDNNNNSYNNSNYSDINNPHHHHDDGNASLEHQIHRRDAYISKVQNDLHRMQSQLAQYRKDGHTIRRQQLESTHRHAIAIKLWRRTNDGLRARVECFEAETTPAAAREIANLIRDAAPPNKDSTYLMMLQDQLTKATVKLDHLGSQTEIVLHKGEEVVESLREEMNEVIRERCRMELELLDQERVLEDDMRRMVVKTERRLKRVQGEIDFLEKNAVECLKNQEEDEDEDDEGGDSDDENKNLREDEGAKGVEDVGEDAKGGENNVGENEKEEDAEEEEDGDDSSSSGSDSSSEESSEEKDEAKDKSEGTADSDDESTDGKGKEQQQQEQTPEILRKELRKLAMERDRSLSVLQKKLREKNEEFHGLMRLRESRLKAIQKLEEEKRGREEWERSRQEGF